MINKFFHKKAKMLGEHQNYGGYYNLLGEQQINISKLFSLSIVETSDKVDVLI